DSRRSSGISVITPSRKPVELVSRKASASEFSHAGFTVPAAIDHFFRAISFPAASTTVASPAKAEAGKSAKRSASERCMRWDSGGSLIPSLLTIAFPHPACESPMACLRYLLLGPMLVLIALDARAGDWPEFRGATAQGLYEGKPLPTEWSREKNIAWR